jgi:hypothetical protein
MTRNFNKFNIAFLIIILILMNILLLRYYLLNSREKFDIIKKTDLQWEYHELANISNLVLKSNTFLKQSNKDSIAISKLLKNKCCINPL